MEMHKCPDCGKRTYSDVCYICGVRIPQGEKMTDQDSTKKKEGFFLAGPLYRHHATVYVGQKAKIFWYGALILFVLIPLLIAGAEKVSKSDAFRYDKAGWGEAKMLPEIESQVLYRGYGVTIKAKSFGMLDGEQTLVITVVNRCSGDIHLYIDSVMVNGCMIPDSIWKHSVEKGKREQVYLILDSQEFYSMNMDAVEEISMEISVIKEDGIYNIPPQYVYLTTSAYDGE